MDTHGSGVAAQLLQRQSDAPPLAAQADSGEPGPAAGHLPAGTRCLPDPWPPHSLVCSAACPPASAQLVHVCTRILSTILLPGQAACQIPGLLIVYFVLQPALLQSLDFFTSASLLSLQSCCHICATVVSAITQLFHIYLFPCLQSFCQAGCLPDPWPLHDGLSAVPYPPAAATILHICFCVVSGILLAGLAACPFLVPQHRVHSAEGQPAHAQRSLHEQLFIACTD